MGAFYHTQCKQRGSTGAFDRTYDGVLLTTISETLVAKALEEFFALHDGEPCWTLEDLHYMKLEQEELKDPPKAHILYDKVKNYLMEQDLWTPP